MDRPRHPAHWSDDRGLTMRRAFRFLDWPLRLKILTVLFVASTVTVLIALAISFRILGEETREKMRDILAAHGDVVAAQLDAFHQEQLHSADRLAVRQDIIDLVAPNRSADVQAVQLILNRKRDLKPEDIFQIAILDQTGKVQLATAD